MSIKLKEIYLKGFKSFGKPTRIPISPKITAIVGPNGSGKSNIVESIQWVFGEHSLKQLRASEKSDIIFKGFGKTASSRTAYVELTFDFDGQEYKIARELDEKGNNRYYINGEQARLKDINEFFGANTMVSIIGQGKIDKIAMATPQELKKVFEDAAGTAVYLERKKEALSKLAGTEANLERIKDILYEIEKNKKSLYIKVKKAEKYKEYSERLEDLKQKYFGAIYTFEKEKLQELEDKHSKMKEELKLKLRTLAEVESKWSVLREEFNKLNKKMEDFTTLLEKQKQRQNQLLDLKNSYTNRLNDLKSLYVEKMSKIDSLNEEKERLKSRENEIQIIYDSLNKEISEKENELSEVEEERNILTSRYSEKEMLILKKKNEHDEIEKNIHKLENERKSLIESIDDFNERLNMVEEQLEAKLERSLDLENEIKELSTNAEKYDQKTSDLLEEIENLKSEIKSLTEQREYLKENLEKIIHRKKEIQSEISILQKQLNEYQGFSNAIKKIFENKDRFPGIIDVIANIIETDEKYVEAIEALLGGRLQHIVVKDAEVAKKILSFAKENKIGRITIIPLDLISSNSSKTSLPKNAIDFAKNLVKVKIDESEKLLDYLFRNDIVVENIDIAVDIKRKYNLRIATLEGDLISSSGSMTGGKFENSSSLLSRKNVLENLRKELYEKEELEKQIYQKLKQLKEKISDLRNYSEVVNSELLEYTSKSSSTKRMLQELLKSESEINKEIKNLEKLKNDYYLKVQGMNERVKIIDTELEKLRKILKEIKVELENSNAQMFDDKEKMDKINEKYMDLQADLRSLYERKLQYDGELKRTYKRVEEIELEASTLLKETKSLKKEIDSIEESIRELEKELKTLKSETESLFNSMNIDKNGKNDKVKQLEELEKQMEDLRAERETLQEKIHEIELEIQKRKLKIENIDEKYRKEVRISGNEIDILKREIEDLENKIKYIGPVDFEVEEEYEKVVKKFEELDLQRKDLEDARKKLIELIEKTDEEATQVFMNTFNTVKKTFKRYIKELFFGGKGDIRLTDKDNVLESGIEIVISKANNRAQKLQLLSGGEKALVGLALLMSLLEAQPSAFYVLDEPDAPLDEFNAERFKLLLKNSSAQIILITHKKSVMEIADIMVGITKVDDISTIVPVRMEEVV